VAGSTLETRVSWMRRVSSPSLAASRSSSTEEEKRSHPSRSATLFFCLHQETVSALILLVMLNVNA